ncbi:hypothetical protein VB776_21845 [Arcicella sp. DC2W]|uniref:Uncharacterized protein n=1 Tax=Arcicella gelida TaxID=2984195 RepID=A0ABU5SAV1_9BACT|nr:hypothetical protein [Arcicella sp. DC2W]MEA5405598.1 hypothetical protein [Arcicella sp. DC2W]
MKKYLLLFALLLCILASSIHFSDNYNFFTITGFTTKNKELTIGKNDNIIFKNLDTNQIKIRFIVNSALFYFKSPTYIKINGKNINKHPFNKNSNIQIDGKNIDCNIIIENLKTLKDKWEYEYYPLHLTIPQNLQNEQSENLKTVFYWAKGKSDPEIIILDKEVLLTSSGSQFSALKEFVQSDISKGFKIEFFEPKSKKIVDGNEIRTIVDIKAIRTEWNANHIFIKPILKDKSYQVLFSHLLSFGIGDKTVSDIENINVIKGVFIKQNESVPDARSYYFDNFSNIFNGLLLKATQFQNQIQFSYFNATTKNLSSFKSRQTDIIPREIEIWDSTETTKLHLTYNYINWLFLLVPFIGLWIVCGVVFGTYYNTIRREQLNEFGGHSIHQDDSVYKKNYLNIITVVVIFLHFKLFIALKLSFTYPYISHFLPISLFLAYTTPFIIVYIWVQQTYMPKFHISWLLLIPVMVILIFFFYYYYYPYILAYDFNLLNPFDYLKNDLVRQKLFQCIEFSVLAIVLILLATIFKKKTKGVISKLELASLIQHAIPLTIVFLCFLPILWRKFTPLIMVSIFFMLINKEFIMSQLPVRINEKIRSRFYFGILLFFVGFNFYIDNGSLTVYLCPTLLLVFIYSNSYIDKIIKYNSILQNSFFKLIILLIPVLLLAGVTIFYTRTLMNPSPNDKRFNERINIFFNQAKVEEVGYSNYDEYLEFITIMENNSADNVMSYPPSLPQLIKASEQLQPIFSKGLYPVIINDLNPIVLLSVTHLFGLLLILLCYWCLSGTLTLKILTDHPYNAVQSKGITPGGLVRVIAWLMVSGNGCWLLLSEFGLLPFTGRLINGLGIDSISEYIETILLFGIMGYRQKSKINEK